MARVNLFSVKGSSVEKNPRVFFLPMLVMFACMSTFGGPFTAYVAAQAFQEESQYSDGSGMMQGMGDMMGGAQRPVSPLEKQIGYLKNAKTEEQREIVKQRITRALGRQYDSYLVTSTNELAQLETRLVKLREKLQVRKSSKDKLIELELQRIVNEVNGLAWPKRMNQRSQSNAYGGMGMGRSNAGFGGADYEAPAVRPSTAFPIVSTQEKTPLETNAKFLPFVELKEDKAKRKHALRQMALAWHNYESAHMHFPANIVDEIGTPILSWRVAILPFIDQLELYEKFHIDEPWDSPHNKKLIAEMPEIYFCNISDGKTNRLGIADRGGVFEPELQLSFADIPDGSSNTLLFAAANDANAAKFWTEPSDLMINQFVNMASGKEISVAICDGSVLALSQDTSSADLRRLATRNDGEVVTDLKGK